MLPRSVLVPPLLLLLIITTAIISPAFTFRIDDSPDEELPFVPYEKGFVDESGKVIPAAPRRINQGYETYIIDEGNRRLQSCPGMIGPLEDGKFYCKAKENGYCDRRSGTCFCNTGYAGSSCEDCDPNHYQLGSLCYKKVMCPNHCSSAGKCDYLTGKCICNEFRHGDDCSDFKCSKYHDTRCTHCNQHHCLQCSPGFSVNKEASIGSQCEPCHRFDSRCSSCNVTHCLGCTDLLLQSIKRSGRREDQDPELPPDELNRQLGISVPFGSQQSNAFDEAEIYDIVDNNMIPLHDSSVQCDQGTNHDASFHCYPIEISNVVCGHQGVFMFSSPEYEVSENAGHIRVTVRRSGGGASKAQVSYGIDHITTTDSDVTPTAFYSTTQTLSFSKHEIQKSFLITIHDDIQEEGNETFEIFLFNPSDQSQLGNQCRSIITILDDEFDTYTGNTSTSTIIHHEGESSPPFFEFSNNNHIQSYGNETLFVIAESQETYDLFSFAAKPELLDERYIYNLDTIDKAGDFSIHVQRLAQGGLTGTYYTDLLLSNFEKSRVDSIINFTWSEAMIKSARWDGFVQSPNVTEECCTFYVTARNVRLWVDRYLIIDEWDKYLKKERIFSGFYDLRNKETLEITLEVRDIETDAQVKLMWSGNGLLRDVIPMHALFWKVKDNNCINIVFQRFVFY